MLTRSSTFLDSWHSRPFTLELRCGVGGGFLLPEPVEEFDDVDGDFLIGDPILPEAGGAGGGLGGGGGGKSRLLSGGGGGNSGDWA